MGQTIKVPLGALTMAPLEELTAATETTATKPHPEATIGPDVGSLTSPQHDGVTFGELIDNPTKAIKKMIQIQATALSNPRVSIPLAIGAAAGVLGLGPRSFAGTRGLAEPTPVPTPPPPPGAPSVGRAIAQAVKQNPDAAIESVPFIGTPIKNLAKLGRAAYEIHRTGSAAAPPAEAAPAPASIPDAVPPPTPTAPPVRAAAPTPKTANTPIEGAVEMPSLEDLQLTKAEIETAVKWHENGVSPETILHRILQSRQLTAKTRTTTPDQAAIEIEYMRTHQGRRQGE